MRYFQKCKTCGLKAWEYKERPQQGQMVSVENVVEAEERGQTNGSMMVCLNCNYPISELELDDYYLIIE